MKNKQKLVFVTGIYPLFKGGAEYQMRLIADRLKEEYEIVFLYLGDVPGQQVAQTRVEEIEGYKTYFIKSCTKLDSLTLKYTYGKRIYEVLKKEKPDFVYQRVLKFMSYYISKYQKELGYQHFIHIADLFTISFKKEGFRNKFNYYFFKKTVAHKPQFVVQTREQFDILKQQGITPVLHVYNMHPVVDLEIEQVVKTKKQEAVQHIVWVANIKPIKRLEIFVEIAEYYKDNASYHFDIIGSIQDSVYAEPILNQMDKLNNITHYTGKDNEFVNQFLLDKASLVVNTSVSEGFSNVFIQSWLRGIPVVSLNSNPDRIFDTYNCLGKFCSNDIGLFKNAIEEIIEADIYEDDAVNCYKISKDLFSFDNVQCIKEILVK